MSAVIKIAAIKSRSTRVKKKVNARISTIFPLRSGNYEEPIPSSAGLKVRGLHEKAISGLISADSFLNRGNEEASALSLGGGGDFSRNRPYVRPGFMHLVKSKARLWLPVGHFRHDPREKAISTNLRFCPGFGFFFPELEESISRSSSDVARLSSNNETAGWTPLSVSFGRTMRAQSV